MAINTDSLIVANVVDKSYQTFWANTSDSPIVAFTTDLPIASFGLTKDKDSQVTPAFVAFAGRNVGYLDLVPMEDVALAAVSGVANLGNAEATLTVCSASTTTLREPYRGGGFYIGKKFTDVSNGGLLDTKSLILETEGPTLYAPIRSDRKFTLEGNYELGETCNIKDKNGNYIVRNGVRVDS